MGGPAPPSEPPRRPDLDLGSPARWHLPVDEVEHLSDGVRGGREHRHRRTGLTVARIGRGPGGVRISVVAVQIQTVQAGSTDGRDQRTDHDRGLTDRHRQVRLAALAIPGGQQRDGLVVVQLDDQVGNAPADRPGPGRGNGTQDGGGNRCAAGCAHGGVPQRPSDPILTGDGAGQVGVHMTDSGLGQADSDPRGEPSPSPNDNPSRPPPTQNSRGRGVRAHGRSQTGQIRDW